MVTAKENKLPLIYLVMHISHVVVVRGLESWYTVSWISSSTEEQVTSSHFALKSLKIDSVSLDATYAVSEFFRHKRIHFWVRH